MRRFFKEQQLLTEKDLRARLTEIGLDEAAATAQIERARKQTALQHGVLVGSRHDHRLPQS